MYFKSYKRFLWRVFKKREEKTTVEIKVFLNVIDVPKLSEDQVKLCEEDLTEKDLYKSLRSMQNDKSPGNDGLTKEFYETFWNDLIEIFVNSVREAKVIGHLRRASVDSKIISKALSEKLTEVLPDLISSQQMAYVKNRHIGESGKLISDIIEMTKIRKIGFLVTMDIEKAFDSLDHNFLISTLEKYGFGQNFILWIKILLNDQESCVINGGKTTKYFMLGRGARQGDPISAFLFILALEILFLLIKTKPEIAGLTIFDHCYLYSAYADDTTFFLKDTISIKNMVDTFHLFSEFSGLKPNLSKCEITGIGVLKGVQVAVCGMRCVDLKNDTLKILGTHFSYNEKLKEEKNFDATVTNIQWVLKIWKMRNLKLEGKIVIFKTLAISKVVSNHW